MTLCNEKCAELCRPEEKKEYEGRIVFRGDDVREIEGYLSIPFRSGQDDGCPRTPLNRP
jgi:hypothetical protein